jgi:carboxyl-terminal processing protease
MNHNQNRSKLIIYYPLFLAGMLVLGIYLGSYFSNDSGGSAIFPKRQTNNADKIGQIINFIDREYVDTVAKNQLIDRAINSILQDLDPHSYYISAEELMAYTEPLEGNFEGIGVEFLIQDDTVRVVSAIEGGPSEELGIMAGDKIIGVDSASIAGVGIKNEDVIALLKGPGGTEVNVNILRNNETIPFAITRGTIPINSVVTSQILDGSVGYIKISRFAKTTYEEFMQSMAQLSSQGMKEVIIDLRGNGGGFLSAAVQISEEFLQKDQLIVYTQGKASPKKEYFAMKKGQYADLPMAILINQGSASASEILAGAIQDNDRGTIIGRRSFGKGLVQEHLDLPDHSALRLTVARYYTPTGRSIQKPYGENVDYEGDYDYRYTHGELMVSDSIQFPDSLKYTTPGGKIVYGGGGIMPDVFVGLDTVGASHYLSLVSYQGILNQFGFDYADAHRSELGSFDSYESFRTNFQVSDDLLEQFIAYADEKGVKRDAKGIQRSNDILRLRIKAYVARNIWGNDGFYSIMNDDDNVLQEAVITLASTRII